MFNSISAVAQCANEPTIEPTGKIIAVREFTVKNAPNEMILTLEVAAENSSWAKAGAEGATLTVFVDGKYNQDVMLFGGAKKFVYQVALGSFEQGKHALAVVFNQTRSAKNSKQAKIYSVKIASANLSDKNSADTIALANSPIIYARPDTIDKFSDIPLVLYYEVFPNGDDAFKIRYTTIFSNEDGGTQTAALMARWGRATDIEWVYEIEFSGGKIVSEIYQGANHETKNYAGKRVFGGHPLIFNTTVNNNFSDAGCSDLRFAPLVVRADLSKKSRETVMDENGWTYRIMAEELLREKRINAAKLDANTIADPRDYIYAEIYSEPENAAINVEAETFGGEKFSSDAGIASLRVSRKGYVRIAMRLPRTKTADFPSSVIVGCYPVSNEAAAHNGACQNVRLIKLVRLDENYQPLVKKIESPPQNIKTGGKSVFAISEQKERE
ncbi:MAG: hypothetical protein M3Q99_07965 [Acidobacteriota bacterium]|nr:hypothetical protein [Acidobacteriota bacterium]